MAMKLVSTKVPESLSEHLEALAYKLRSTPAEITRRLLEEAVKVNPITEGERDAARRARNHKMRGEVPGLVMPTTPLASGAGGTAEIHCLAEYAGQVGNGLERRWRDSNPRWSYPQT